MRTIPTRAALALTAALSLLAFACVTQGAGQAGLHRWWAGLGPVLPHESFPADCGLCHTGEGWNTLVEDFAFDHEAETGVALEGAHLAARCIRCHNDRGPVAVFDSIGCAGCHEDVHLGRIGQRCEECHRQETWRPYGQVERHLSTRFPLVGVHAATACRRCHPGSEVGVFRPTSTECVACHAADLARTTNHVGLGWVDSCDRCHMPTTWQQAEID